MRPSWHKYLDRNVPRYTSYPSALAFSDSFETGRYLEALDGIGADEPVSLYLHVPFCKQLCWYCGCNMRVENRPERISAFADDLLAELALIAGRLGGNGKITQVHFGGGTPNTLSRGDLVRVLDFLRDRFPLDDDTPIVMEIDPRLDPGEQASDLVEAGISRFSIGVQDFDPGVQKAINRVQPFSLVEATVRSLRTAGVDDISFDVLYGLPRQTICRFRRTIEQVVGLRPDRVSLFGYAHMPARLKHQRLIAQEDLPGRALRLTLEEMAGAALRKAGYERIGFDHYALPSSAIAEAARAQRLNRNFQGFTEDAAETVIAAGPSAIGTVRGIHAQNAKDLRDYRAAVRAGSLPIERGVAATRQEEDLGQWLRRLLCDLRGDLRQYCAITGNDAEGWEKAAERLGPLIADRIVRMEGSTVVIDDDAKPLARLVASMFDPAVKDQSSFASPAV